MIEPTETEIIGRWVPSKEGLVPDSACHRIAKLTEGYLIKLGSDASGWDLLYRDPNDGRFWELTYPQSQMHGGGPPVLRDLPESSARRKYGDVAIEPRRRS